METGDTDPTVREDALACLGIARRALCAACEEGRGLPPDDLPATRRLTEPSGLFVTLRKGSALRGCIGYPEASLPMREAAWSAAQMAALEDPRFPPLQAAELSGLDVEVSLLTPQVLMGSVQEFEPGVDGAVLVYEGRRSLYLPEVAIETGWGRERFFTELARKAGLPPETWRRAALYRFGTFAVAGPAVTDAAAD